MSDWQHLPTTDAPGRHEAGVTEALEHVYESGQTLLVRRLELLIGEMALEGRALIDQARDLIGSGMLAGAGILIALAGWLLTVAGILRAAEGYFPRYAAELGMGALHCIVGIALAYRFFGPRKERTR